MTLVFPIMMRTSPGGAVMGTSETWLTIGPGPEQAPEALSFENVTVTPNGALRGATTDGFTVSFLLQPGSPGVETIWPILEMTWWGDWNTGIATASPVLAAAGGGGATLTV
ncbi:hypothetical protein K8I85_12545, partial [bacterium]|nr:hypothetical protein [bacterium]